MKQFTKILFPVAVLFLLSSCSKDPYVDFNYELTCSEDLLEYVTPVVTYTGNNANSVTFRIDESEWKEKSENLSTINVSVIIDGEKMTKDTKRLYWQKKVKYGDDDFTIVEDKMLVKYELKKGVTPDMLPKNFYPIHYLTTKIEMRDEDENNIQRTFANYSISIGKEENILDKVDCRGFIVKRTGEIIEKGYEENK